jgi:hypothetical protein
MSTAASFPTIRPSLLLDFANSGVLDPRITFSRSTTATYYDGVTTAKAEENLALQSQTFDSTSWAKSGSATVTSDSTTAPDGTSTADTLNGAAGSSYIIQAISITTGLSYTFSVFAKADSTNFLQIAGGSSVFGTDVWADFDLSAGTVGSTGTLSTASIVSVGSGWYRCVVTGTSTATSTVGNAFGVIPVESSSATRFPTNVGATSIYIWGAQAEQRSAVTAYTPTTTQPITNYIPVLQTAAANVARFDHNPTTGEALGLLIEEQRTNLLTYSADFSNVAWSKVQCTVTSNAVVAPDGTLSADKLVLDNGISPSGATNDGMYRISVLASGVYTYSIYAKAGEFSSLRVRESLSSGAFLDVNLLTGAITNGSLTQFVDPQAINVGNGWWRTQTGDGYSGIYIWGAQLEAGAFPTSYIATTSATVTRNADEASMTGTNFSSWYRADEGTLFGDFKSSVVPSSGNSVVSIGSSATNAFGIYSLSAYQLRNIRDGASNVLLDAGSASLLQRKVAAAIKTNDFALSLDSGATVSDTDALLQSSANTTMYLGSFGGIDKYNGTIKKIAYYPVRLSNANLQALTA